MTCVYVAIGQKASSIKNVVRALEQHGAIAYTVVVAASAYEPAAMQYVSGLSGCTMGEYFRDRGEDALIVYDDLSKQVGGLPPSVLVAAPPARPRSVPRRRVLSPQPFVGACRSRQRQSGSGPGSGRRSCPCRPSAQRRRAAANRRSARPAPSRRARSRGRLRRSFRGLFVFLLDVRQVFRLLDRHQLVLAQLAGEQAAEFEQVEQRRRTPRTPAGDRRRPSTRRSPGPRHPG